MPEGVTTTGSEKSVWNVSHRTTIECQGMCPPGTTYRLQKTGPNPGADTSPENVPVREANGRQEASVLIKRWTVFVTLFAALIGVGFGLFEILADVFDETIIEFDDLGPGMGLEAIAQVLGSIPILGTPCLAIGLAAFLGAFIGATAPYEDDTAYKVGGVAAGVGTTVLWAVAVIFASVPIDGSIDFGGLVISLIVAGVVAGLVAAGGVWIVRNRAPELLVGSRVDERR